MAKTREKPREMAYVVKAKADDGSAFLQLVDVKTEAPLSPVFSVAKKKLAALKKIATVIEGC